MLWATTFRHYIRCHPPSFHKQFTIKAAVAHHFIIKEVDELLAKGATESSTDCTAFTLTSLWCLCVWVVYIPYFHLKQFNCYMQIPSFNIPTVKQVWHIIQHSDCTFSIKHESSYLHIPFVMWHHCSSCFVWYKNRSMRPGRFNQKVVWLVYRT